MLHTLDEVVKKICESGVDPREATIMDISVLLNISYYKAYKYYTMLKLLYKRRPHLLLCEEEIEEAGKQ